METLQIHKIIVVTTDISTVAPENFIKFLHQKAEVLNAFSNNAFLNDFL